jgi:hypothetical protein
MFDAGLTLFDVQRRLGHRSPTMTAEVYTHLMRERFEEGRGHGALHARGRFLSRLSRTRVSSGCRRGQAWRAACRVTPSAVAISGQPMPLRTSESTSPAMWRSTRSRYETSQTSGSVIGPSATSAWIGCRVCGSM